MSTFDYDLFVIGAGSGGVRAARMAAQAGARVAIAEEDRVGGTCVIRGCVPKKLFVYASRFGKDFDDARAYGWEAAKPAFDWPTLIANKDAEIDRLNRAYIDNLEKAGVELFQTRAVLEDAHHVRLLAQQRTVSAGTILIATGGHPNPHRDLEGHELAIVSDEAFHLERLPGRIVIAGAGYIAVEFANIFHGLGVDVTLIYRGPMILSGFDDDLRHALHEQMAARGIRFVFHQVFEKLERKKDGILGTTNTGEQIEADTVFLALGRVPNTQGLGLEAAGVATGRRGEIAVDEYSRTPVPNIYAIGDVTDRMQLTPVAIMEAMAFARTVFEGKPTRPDHRMVPTAVFSQPEIGTVGYTEVAARKEFGEIDVYKSTFRPMKHTLTGREERSLMKLVVEAKSGRVVGCHILGPDAGEMIQCLGIAVKMGATKADFDATVAVHPTAAEELVTLREKAPPTEREAAE